MKCHHCGKSINLINPEHPFTSSEVQRFWKSVTKSDGCWECRLNPKGTYSRLRIGERQRLGHVVSWLITHGSIPEGMKVCHKCDNPRCVRPDHLFLGTHVENMRDMRSKGRGYRGLGELNHLAKLTAEKVLSIRNELANKTATIQQLANLYNTSFQGIYHVARGTVWKEVGGPLLEKRQCRKLTESEVVEIRKLAREGVKQAAIAERFGIKHAATVCSIINGKKWKHIPL